VQWDVLHLFLREGRTMIRIDGGRGLFTVSGTEPVRMTTRIPNATRVMERERQR
jgi:hypothetical protein